VPAPEKLTIETPEQIALEFTLASVGSRFLALGVDTLLQGGGFLALGLLALALLRVSPIGGMDIRTWGFAVLLLAAFCTYYGYFAAFEALWNGQTPGKRAIGLRVIAASGRPLSVHEAVLRNVVRIADQLPGVYAVGILSVFLTARHQRLGDLAAGTVVVHERPMERFHAGLEGRELRARHGARRLRPEEIALIETFLRRRLDLSETQRARTAQEIATRIEARLGVASVDDHDRFLEDVVAEYRSTGGHR
jgi:uncharacterized RDD family membrane protein YckC